MFICIYIYTHNYIYIYMQVGGYAYLDGELHVRVNLACDAIMQSVIANYGAKNTRLANLCTPTGVTFMCLHIHFYIHTKCVRVLV